MNVLPVENLMVRTLRRREYEEGRVVSARRLKHFIPEDNPEVETVSEHAVRGALAVLVFHGFLGNESAKGAASFFVACDLEAAAAQAVRDVEQQLRGLQDRITIDQITSIKGQAARLRGLPPSEWSGLYVRISLGRSGLWDANGTALRRSSASCVRRRS